MRISDWSSDVCSSDLIAADKAAAEARAVLAQRNLARERQLYEQEVSARVDYEQAQAEAGVAAAEARRAPVAARRSEEHRVGKECDSTVKSRWSPFHSKKTTNKINTKNEKTKQP